MRNVKSLLLAAGWLSLAASPALPQALPSKAWAIQSPLIAMGDCVATVSAATTLAAVCAASCTAAAGAVCGGGIPTAAAIQLGATFAVVQVETNAARWRDSGAAPTAGAGQPLSVLTPIYFTSQVLGGTPLGSVQFIPQTGSMTIDVSFYGIR